MRRGLFGGESGFDVSVSVQRRVSQSRSRRDADPLLFRDLSRVAKLKLSDGRLRRCPLGL